VQEANDAGVPPLADDPPEQRRLVAQQLSGGRVEAELEGDAVGQVGVLGLPDLAEAAAAQQLLQLPVHAGQRPVAGSEARQLRGQQGQQALRPLERQARGHGAAGGVGRAALGVADGGGGLGQVGRQGHAHLLGLPGGLLGGGLLRLLQGLRGGQLGHLLEFRPQLLVGAAPGPPLPHVPGDLGQDLDGEVAGDPAAHDVEGGLGEELEEGAGGRHGRLPPG
jgi:hypothetical protein